MSRHGIIPALFAIAVAGIAETGERPVVTPAFVAADHAVGYAGPGRDEAVPEGLTTVDIGYFGPGDESDAANGDLWRAATLAIDKANAEGGFHGLAFRLVPVGSTDPWGTGIRDLARMVFADPVWALVGSVDGASTHLAEQIVVKARLPLISPVSTDLTVNLANVSWTLSLSPGDDRLTAALVEQVTAEPFALISATDHDSHAATVEFYRQLSARGAGPRFHFEIESSGACSNSEEGFGPDSPGFTDPELRNVVDRVVDSEVPSVVILAGAADSARLTLALSESSSEIRIFGGASMGRRCFLDRAGSAAEGIVFSSPCPPAALDGPVARNFRERFGLDPDCATLQTYDSIDLIVAGLRRSGLNRPRLGDTLRELAPWSGVSGTIAWDPLGRNRRPVGLATVRGGKVRTQR